MRCSDRVTEPGAQRTHQPGDVEVLPGTRGYGVATSTRIDEVEQEPTTLAQQVRRPGHRSAKWDQILNRYGHAARARREG